MNETNTDKKLKPSITWAGIIVACLVLIPIFFCTRISSRHFRRQAFALRCGINLKVLGTAILVYAIDHDGYLPTAENWCDLLITEADVNPDMKGFLCKASDAVKGESSYALNKSITGLKLDEIPQEVVLLFETTPG